MHLQPRPSSADFRPTSSLKLEHISLRVDASDTSSIGTSDTSSSDNSDDDANSSCSDDDGDSVTKPSDSLGFVPVLLAGVASSTCVGTVAWGCVHPRIDCRVFWPTLSDAARFRPQQSLFAIGMLLTALLWATTLLLFHWHSRLVSARRHRVLTSGILLSGLVSAMSTLALGFMDARIHHDGHVNATAAFFLATWTTVGLICVLRRRMAQPPPSSIKVVAEGAATTGLVALAFHGVAVLCTSDVLPNVFGLSPSHVVLSEYAVVSGLVAFATTLRHELALLTPLVEANYFAVLRRVKGK